MVNKKGQIMVHWIIGILLISGGLLFFFSQPILGAILASFGLLLELFIKYFKELI